MTLGGGGFTTTFSFASTGNVPCRARDLFCTQTAEFSSTLFEGNEVGGWPADDVVGSQVHETGVSSA